MSDEDEVCAGVGSFANGDNTNKISKKVILVHASPLSR